MTRRRMLMGKEKSPINILKGLVLRYSNVGTAIYAASHGELVTYTAIGQACLTYIDVKKIRGKTLVLNHRPTGNTGGFAFYRTESDATSSFVSGFTNSGVNTQGEWTIQVPTGDDVNYMRFTANPNYIDDVQIILID